RQLKSDVWPHFQWLIVNGNLKLSTSTGHKQLVGHSLNGIIHLRNHMQKCIQKKIYDGR
ncbi:hypothetical protein LINGRAHAP2_LOCUS30911, partial [Linum grandiflorum]